MFVIYISISLFIKIEQHGFFFPPCQYTTCLFVHCMSRNEMTSIDLLTLCFFFLAAGGASGEAYGVSWLQFSVSEVAAVQPDCPPHPYKPPSSSMLCSMTVTHWFMALCRTALRYALYVVHQRVHHSVSRTESNVLKTTVLNMLCRGHLEVRLHVGNKLQGIINPNCHSAVSEEELIWKTKQMHVSSLPYLITLCLV